MRHSLRIPSDRHGSLCGDDATRLTIIPERHTPHVPVSPHDDLLVRRRPSF